MTTNEQIDVLIIYPDGRATDVCKIDKSLKAMQSIVGGYIELAGSFNGLDIWCNEEGLLIGLEYNLMASRILGAMPGRTDNPKIVGTVLVTGSPDADGATTSIGAEGLESLLEVVAKIQSV